MREHAIFTSDIAMFFMSLVEDSGQAAFPHLKTLNVTIRGGKIAHWKAELKTRTRIARKVDELWISAVNVRGLTTFNDIHFFFYNTKALFWKETLCRFHKPRANFGSPNSIVHLNVSARSQLLDFIVRYHPMFPKLQTLF